MLFYASVSNISAVRVACLFCPRFPPKHEMVTGLQKMYQFLNINRSPLEQLYFQTLIKVLLEVHNYHIISTVPHKLKYKWVSQFLWLEILLHYVHIIYMQGINVSCIQQIYLKMSNPSIMVINYMVHTIRTFQK